MSVTIREIAANGMTFRCREAGPADGEPVILLHGFPETSHSYIRLMETLAGEGYRSLAPDQRGYSPGARPVGVEHYRYAAIGSDVLAIADAAGFDRFHLVGHDWGALAGWTVVCTHPERVLTWTALSVPHTASFGGAILNDPDQQTRSQYINTFRQEGTAEEWLLANDFEVLRRIWSMSAPEELAEYIEIMTAPGAITGGLNWYRASNGISPTDDEVTFGEVAVPTTMIWGNGDGAIGRTSYEGQDSYMTGPFRKVELDAGHWLLQEKPDEVAEEVLARLKSVTR